jgi:hypothetical protein
VEVVERVKSQRSEEGPEEKGIEEAIGFLRVPVLKCQSESAG